MKQQPGSEKGEDFDVAKVHGQIVREKPDPIELLRSAPGWLKHGIYAPLLIWGFVYLLNSSGGFRWDEYNEGPVSTTVTSAESSLSTEAELPAPKKDSASDSLREEGMLVYQQVCLACHQSNGAGLAGVFPPLAGSEWVSGNENRLAGIVLYGLMGPIEVKGLPWNGVMPPQGATLDDRKIAAVLTYIRSDWGNDSPPVEPDMVKEVREKFSDHAPWTMETLEAAFP